VPPAASAVNDAVSTAVLIAEPEVRYGGLWWRCTYGACGHDCRKNGNAVGVGSSELAVTEDRRSGPVAMPGGCKDA